MVVMVMRYATETIRHPFDARNEEMKQNSRNKLYLDFARHQETFGNKMESFKEM